jgi:hypothetical protein
MWNKKSGQRLSHTRCWQTERRAIEKMRRVMRSFLLEMAGAQ